MREAAKMTQTSPLLLPLPLIDIAFCIYSLPARAFYTSMNYFGLDCILTRGFMNMKSMAKHRKWRHYMYYASRRG
ncbi:hypothetical protein BJV78DRAFT_1201969 [Lactifluus subvellereus]|nr:hypothetical protein BJV78DRAFT_1201969 [Lactifluus subvellereus]